MSSLTHGSMQSRSTLFASAGRTFLGLMLFYPLLAAAGLTPWPFSGGSQASSSYSRYVGIALLASCAWAYIGMPRKPTLGDWPVWQIVLEAGALFLGALAVAWGLHAFNVVAGVQTDYPGVTAGLVLGLAGVAIFYAVLAWWAQRGAGTH